MDGLTGIGYGKKEFKSVSTSIKNVDEGVHTAEGRTTAGRADTLQDSRTPEEKWEQAIKTVEAFLKNAFSTVRAEFADLSDSVSLAKYASNFGKGVSIVFSREFLEGLAAEGDTKKAKTVIGEVMARLSNAYQALGAKGVQAGGVVVNSDGEVSVWAKAEDAKDKEPESDMDKFLKMMLEGGLAKHYKEKGGRSVTEIKTQDGTIKLVIVKKLNYMPGRDLANLARLRMPYAVRSFISGMHANINRMNTASGYDDDQKKVAVSQMKSVIMRARVKIKKLDEESVLQKRCKKAEERSEMRKKLALEHELRQRQAARRSREYGQIFDKLEPLELPGRPKSDPEWEDDLSLSGAALSFTGASGPAAPLAAQGDIASMAAAGTIDILV